MPIVEIRDILQQGKTQGTAWRSMTRGIKLAEKILDTCPRRFRKTHGTKAYGRILDINTLLEGANGAISRRQSRKLPPGIPTLVPLCPRELWLVVIMPRLLLRLQGRIALSTRV